MAYVQAPCLENVIKPAGALTSVRNHLILPLGLALATAGCAAGPDYTSPGSPALGIPAQYHQQEGVPVSDEALASWWTRFDDPVLNTLVERSEEHTSELQSLMRISYAVFCLKKKK